MKLYISIVTALALTTAASAEAPTASALARTDVVQPGEVFPVDYTISWTGAADAYTVLPPDLPELAWGEAVILESSSQSQDDRHETRITVGYRANVPGAYETPTLTFRFAAWEGAAPTTITTLEETTPAAVLDVAPVLLVFRASQRHWWYGGALLLALLACVAGYVYFRKRTTPSSNENCLSPSEQARALLHEARRHRLDGDYYLFYKTLLRAHETAAPLASSPDPGTTETLRKRINDTGYRGLRPSDDDIEGDFKRVERLVAQLGQPSATGEIRHDS